MIFAQLEEENGSRIAEDVKGYSKAIDIFEKHMGRLPETIDSSLQIFKKMFVYVIVMLYTKFQCPTVPGAGQKVCVQCGGCGVGLAYAYFSVQLISS